MIIRQKHARLQVAEIASDHSCLTPAATMILRQRSRSSAMVAKVPHGLIGVPANGGSEGWPVGLANLNGGVRQSQPSLATLAAHSLENADALIV